MPGLSDDVLHATDVQDKVRAIERFDAQVVGPILTALAKHPAYRLLVVCDPGLAKSQGSEVPPILYALCDSAAQPPVGARPSGFTSRMRISPEPRLAMRPSS